MKTKLFSFQGVIWGSLALAVAPLAPAAEIGTFTIDPAVSSVTLSGNIVGNNIAEQGQGSLRTILDGSIRAEVAPGTIKFVGGSQIDPRTNGVWEPLLGGADGAAPADFGGKATSFLASAKAALRNLLLDVTSGQIALVNQTQFNADGLVFGFIPEAQATLDYVVTGFLNARDSEPLAGLSTNKIATLGSLAQSGGFEVLTLPIDTSLGFQLLTENDSQITLRGTLVAKRPAATTPLTLSITVTNRQVILSWPSATGSGYSVHSSSDLKQWAPRTGNTTTQEDRVVWTSEQRGTTEFFQLAK
jgi:hypothetical protein